MAHVPPAAPSAAPAVLLLQTALLCSTGHAVTAYTAGPGLAFFDLLRQLRAGSRLQLRARHGHEAISRPPAPTPGAIAPVGATQARATELLRAQQELIHEPTLQSQTLCWIRQAPTAVPPTSTDRAAVAQALAARQVVLPAEYGPQLARAAALAVAATRDQGFPGAGDRLDATALWAAWHETRLQLGGEQTLGPDGTPAALAMTRGAVQVEGPTTAWRAVAVLPVAPTSSAPEHEETSGGASGALSAHLPGSLASHLQGVLSIEHVLTVQVVRDAQAQPSDPLGTLDAECRVQALLFVTAGSPEALDAWFRARPALQRARTLDPHRIRHLWQGVEPTAGEAPAFAVGVSMGARQAARQAAQVLGATAWPRGGQPRGPLGAAFRLPTLDGHAITATPRGPLNGNAVWMGKVGCGMSMGMLNAELLPAVAAGESVVYLSWGWQEALVADLGGVRWTLEHPRTARARRGEGADSGSTRRPEDRPGRVHGLDPVRWATDGATPDVLRPVFARHLVRHLLLGDEAIRDEAGPEIRVIEAALDRVLDRPAPVYDDLLAELERLAELDTPGAAGLLPRARLFGTTPEGDRGRWASLLEGTGVDWTQQLLSFDLGGSDLPPDVESWCAAAVLALAVRPPGVSGTPLRTVILDEAASIVGTRRDTPTGRLLERVAREGRKTGVRLVVRWHNVGDVMASDLGRVVAGNASTHWIGLTEANPSNRAGFQQLGGTSEAWAQLTELRWTPCDGQGAPYLRRDGDEPMTGVRVRVSPELYWLTTSDPQDLARLRETVGDARPGTPAYRRGVQDLAGRVPRGVRCERRSA